MASIRGCAYSEAIAFPLRRYARLGLFVAMPYTIEEECPALPIVAMPFSTEDDARLCLLWRCLLRLKMMPGSA